MYGEMPMKLLFINHWARSMGGAELSLLDIVRETALRHEVHLVTSEHGPLVEKALQYGVHCRVIHCAASLTRVRRNNLIVSALINVAGLVSFFRFVFEVRTCVAQVKPQLIHANVPKSHITLFLLRVLGYRGCCCFHIREIFKDRSFASLLYKVLFPRSHVSVIAISHAVKNSLPRKLYESARVLYNGIMIPEESSRNGDYSTIRFLYIGRIVPWKGCHLLIEAFAKLNAAGIPCSLSCIGDTLYWGQGYRKLLEQKIAASSLQESCRIEPHTGDPLGTMKKYHVFCIASDREPFGRVVAEAQACGLPVIAFDNGGIPEIVANGESGLIVPYGDVEGFRNAMEWFREDPSRITAMGANGRARALEMFDGRIQVPRIVEYIEECAQG